MANIINLPDRQGTITYDEDDVQDVLDALFEAGNGQGVVVDDAQESETKARVRAGKMRDLLKRDHADALAGHKVRSHVVPDGDEYVPVLSIKATTDE